MHSCTKRLAHGNAEFSRLHDMFVLCGRGRAERMAFADSFVQAYHFRLLYLSSAMMYPIMGAMRHSYGQPWEVTFRSTCYFSSMKLLSTCMY